MFFYNGVHMRWRPPCSKEVLATPQLGFVYCTGSPDPNEAELSGADGEGLETRQHWDGSMTFCCVLSAPVFSPPLSAAGVPTTSRRDGIAPNLAQDDPVCDQTVRLWSSRMFHVGTTERSL
ncbi:unnamed protein product [Boreogadus saida]